MTLTRDFQDHEAVTDRRDTIRAGLYQRVSRRVGSAADREEERSIEQQDAGNREACERRGWAVTAEYKDEGLSASRFAGAKGGSNRKDYRQALADVKAGRIDVLVMWESSRGSRELENWAHLLNACRVAGVLIHVTSHDRTYDLSVGRDWRSLAEDGVDSAYESEKLSMRIQRGKAAGRAAGRPQQAPAYGVQRIWDNTRRKFAWLRDEPHPETAPVCAVIIRAVAAGYGYQAIAHALNGVQQNVPEGEPDPAEGILTDAAVKARVPVPSPKGGLWTRMAVTSVAGREVYATLGIVTEAESLKARERLTDTRRKGERPSAARYRYSAVMHCGKCGTLAKGTTRRDTELYGCPNGHVYVNVEAADTFIDEIAIERLSRANAITLFSRTDNEAVLEARTEAAKWRQKLSDSAAAFSADRITLDQLEAITASCKPKAEAADKRAQEASVPSPLAGLPGDREEVAERWAALTLTARKAAVRALMPDMKLMPADRHQSAPVDERIIPWPED